jgi:CheY-like chemotaxis protein
MGRDPIKILIVDDDEEVLIELERLLEGEGYLTATAWSGREALELSEKLEFDLLLVDEYVGDVESNALWEELQRRQPNAFRFLMHTRRDTAPKSPAASHIAVCKWEHGEVKSQIRKCLAA